MISQYEGDGGNIVGDPLDNVPWTARIGVEAGGFSLSWRHAVNSPPTSATLHRPDGTTEVVVMPDGELVLPGPLAPGDYYVEAPGRARVSWTIV
jgi:hypothetical protein